MSQVSQDVSLPASCTAVAAGRSSMYWLSQSTGQPPCFQPACCTNFCTTPAGAVRMGMHLHQIPADLPQLGDSI
jgi:hypothetical protein